MKLNRNAIIFNLLFFSSFMLNLLNLKLYEKTIIRIEVIAIIYLLGILFFFIFKNKLKQLSPWNHFNNFVFSIFVIGSYLTLLLLGLNYYYASQKTELKTFEIVRKTEILGPKFNRSNKSPAAMIKIDKNNTKRIAFARNLKDKLDISDSLELSLSKGLFNFYIIRNKKLK